MDFRFPDDFLFGVANAPAQVEDQLEDVWARFARAGGVRCFDTVPNCHERLRFWSEPEIEIELAGELGVRAFRLGIDWGRLVPARGEWNQAAADHYRKILTLIRANGMEPWVTLFHHSVPPWLEDEGGWSTPRASEDFGFFSRHALDSFGDLVGHWLTLNEPVPWAYLTYKAGLFSPGKKGSVRDVLRALGQMKRAHFAFYHYAHSRSDCQVGFAHNMAIYSGRSPVGKLIGAISDELLNWVFLRSLARELDFIGVNYYGREWMTLRGPAEYPELEYSDAGRAVYPEGLTKLLLRIHRLHPGKKIFITENGVGDGTDELRPAYLVEHLVAIHQAITLGAPVKGYLQWSLTDNWEWSDGYGPKFGLVEVDRKDMSRNRRGSFSLYQQIIRDHGFSEEQRQSVWSQYRRTIGKLRPYWRSEDNIHALDVPRLRKTPDHDWRVFRNSPAPG